MCKLESSQKDENRDQWADFEKSYTNLELVVYFQSG